MNKNPLLIKNFLTGKIPFMKNKTLDLYRRYISNGRLNQLLSSEDTSETLSAYTLLNNYKTDFIFDQIKVTNSVYFSEKEWVALGLLLRAYKEVENISLMHLYNCIYSGENNKVSGYVANGREYTLYSSTQMPVTILYPDYGVTIGLGSLSRNEPYHFTPQIIEVIPDTLIKIEIFFTNLKHPQATLVEGNYKGLSYLGNLIGKYQEKIYRSETGKIVRTEVKDLIPEPLRIGEYSERLVEFFAGTLITPLSDKKLITSVFNSIPGTGKTFEEKCINSQIGIYNKDGYCGKGVLI